MQIVQCIASKGSLFSNTMIELGASVNVVFGQSDSGKTLLFNALCDTIWGGPGTAASDRSLWEDFWLNCVTEVFGKRYRVIRDIDGVSVTGLSASRTVSQGSAADGDFFREVRNVFRTYYDATFAVGSGIYFRTCFAQSPVDEQRYMDTFEELRPLLMNDISSYYSKFELLDAFFDTENIDNQLLVYTNRIQKELRECEREIEIRNIRHSKYVKLQNEGLALKEEIEALESEKKDLNGRRGAVAETGRMQSKLRDLIAENESLRELLEHEHDKRGKVASIEKLIKRTYPRFQKIKKDSGILAGIKNEFTVIQSLLQKRLDLSDRLAEARSVNIRRTGGILLLLALASAGYFLFMDSIPAGYRTIAAGTVSGLSVLTVVIGVIMHFFYGRRFNDDEINTTLEERFKTLRSLLHKTNIDSSAIESDELYELILHFFQEFDSYAEQKDELESVSSSIDLKNEAEIEKKINANITVMAEVEQTAANLCKRHGISFNNLDDFNSSGEFLAIDQEIEKIDAEIQKNSVLYREIQNELDRFGHGGAAEDQLSERYDSLREQYETLKRRVDSVRGVLELMTECVAKRERKLFESFSATGYRIFNELTEGKTSLNSEDMYRKVLSRPLEEVFPKPSLRQIFLLSEKLALGDFISIGGERLPLILDEPCVYMDKKRIEIVLKYIEIAAQRRQVVILTHDQQTYRRFGRHIEIS